MSFLTTRPRSTHAANGGKSMADMFGTGGTASRFHAAVPARSNSNAARSNVSTLWGNGSLTLSRRDSNFLA